MINFDDDLAQSYLSESGDHLAAIEKDLIAIELGGAEIDEAPVNRVFRALHSVKGGAEVFDLVKIRDLAHQTEQAMARVRARQMVPTPNRVTVLLHATDRLHELIQNPGDSNQADISADMAALASMCSQDRPSAGDCGAPATGPKPPRSTGLRVLLAEDDFASRLLLQTFLSRYGECHVAVNGREAVEAVRSALEGGQRYDLICMDIMMPEMDGREAVRQVRALEEDRKILSTDGAKIIMTTAVDDLKEVILCFWELCDAYLVKPIDLAKLLSLMKTYDLVQQPQG